MCPIGRRLARAEQNLDDSAALSHRTLQPGFEFIELKGLGREALFLLSVGK